MLTVATQAVFAAEDWWKVAHRLAPATTLDFTPHGTQPGLFNPLQFADQCFRCHSANQGDPATAFRPYTAWAGSMKANATRDPLFFAALDVANNDVPGSGDFCLRCHTPRGWLDGHVIKAGFGAPNNDVTLGAAGCLLGGAYDSADDLNSDFGGVTCHFCHRLMPQGTGRRSRLSRERERLGRRCELREHRRFGAVPARPLRLPTWPTRNRRTRGSIPITTRRARSAGCATT